MRHFIRAVAATAPRALALTAALTCTALAATAAAQDRLELFPPTPEVGGEFGRAVALDADRLVVGSPGATNDDVPDSGAAWVYERRGASWVVLQRLAAPTPIEGESFGYAVALHGDLLVVGAAAVGTEQPPGTAFVFRAVDGVWEFEQRLDVASATHRFGRTVAVGPGTVVVADSTARDGDGEVTVFERVDGAWTEVAALSEVAAAPTRNFGNSIDLEGDTIAVGVNGASSFQGRAVTYRRSPTGAWELLQTLSAESNSNQYGRSVRLSGDALAVAASHDQNGRIFLYRLDEDRQYVREQVFQYTQTVGFRGGGVSMALDGDVLWAGLWRAFSSSEQGAAFSFQRRDGTWEFARDALPEEPLARNDFGRSIDVDGTTAVVGSRLDDRAAQNAGSILLLGDAGTQAPPLRLLPLETNVVTTGVAQRFQFETFGGLDPTQLEPLTGDVPVAGQLDLDTFVLSGDALAPGTYTFTATAVDAAGTRENQEFTVQVLSRPTVTTQGLPTAVAARPFTTRLAGQTDAGGLTWTLVDGALPDGVAFDPTDGTLSGTPQTSGVFPLRFTADDERGGSSDVTEIALRVGSVVDLSSRRHKETLTDVTGTVERTLELVRGTRLSVALSDRGAKGARIELRDNAGTPVDLGTSLRGTRVRRFEIPATGRYFLRVTPLEGARALRIRVGVAGPRRATGTTVVTVDGTSVVEFPAVPGARVKLSVQPSAGSAAVPAIEFLTDPRVGALLTPQAVRARRRGAVATALVPLRGGGELAAGFRAQGVTFGEVRWKATIRSPETYTFVLPAVSSGD